MVPGSSCAAVGAAAITAAVDGTMTGLGRIDILFNNAGICAYGLSHELAEDEWDAMIDINLKGAWLVGRRVIPVMIEQGSGSIVNISSIMGSIGETAGGGAVVYRSSKAALNMVSKCLSAELAPRDITVIAFHPGWVSTDMGGPDAAVTPGESVEGMRAVI